MVLVQQSMDSGDADWFGNLINWFFLNMIMGICAPFGFLFVLFGDPQWYYMTITGLDMFPPLATDYALSFDA